MILKNNKIIKINILIEKFLVETQGGALLVPRAHLHPLHGPGLVQLLLQMSSYLEWSPPGGL